MLEIRGSQPGWNGTGATRRAALKAGFLGLSGLSLAGQRRLQAESGTKGNDKAVILFWLDGGPSQLESYDPKPDAPYEVRGPFSAIDTNVPGIHLSELLPNHAKFADKMNFIRSLHHGTGDHFAGGHWMLTGRFGATTANKEIKYPSVGSCVSKVRGPRRPGLPAYVGLPAAQSIYLFPGYQGSAYLGGAYNPFDVDTQQKYLHHTSVIPIDRPKCFKAAGDLDAGRGASRTALMTSLDRIRRDVDHSGMMETMDAYNQEAMSLVFGDAAIKAFDISKEDPKVAARYPDHAWGRYTLMARRLVEAGVTFVTVDMPHWDHHSQLVTGHAPNMRAMDQCVGALMTDLVERNMLDQVLVIVMGEFGRTPKINTGLPNDPIPGRDHWGDAISVMLAGGGLKQGTVVGATNPKAEFPVERALKPHDLLATVYRVLGIDGSQSFPDFSGRPVPLVDDATAITELL
jgi:hypothetical protein